MNEKIVQTLSLAWEMTLAGEDWSLPSRILAVMNLAHDNLLLGDDELIDDLRLLFLVALEHQSNMQRARANRSWGPLPPPPVRI